MSKRHPDSPVPARQELACTLWKCHQYGVQGPGDDSVSWWTLQPIEREWWIRTAEMFRDALVAHPSLLGSDYLGAADLVDKIGTIVHEQRTSRGLTFREVAQISGVNLSTLHKVEHGGSFTAKTAIALLLWLDLLAVADAR